MKGSNTTSNFMKMLKAAQHDVFVGINLTRQATLSIKQHFQMQIGTKNYWIKKIGLELELEEREKNNSKHVIIVRIALYYIAQTNAILQAAIGFG